MKHTTSAKGFTLSELLIAIAILGLIATFTIPKVLQSVGNSTNKAIGKETASVISQAYDGLKADSNGSVPNTITAASLIGKVNYVQALTSATSINSVACATSAVECYQLHNGGILQVTTTDTFGTDNTGTIVFNLDPDGATGTNTPISFVLGHDGRIMTGGVTTGGSAAAAPFTSYGLTGGLTRITTDPSWFSWN